MLLPRRASCVSPDTDAGTSKGELLKLEEAGVLTIDWDGRRFPTVEHEGEQVVEALPQRPGVLPHLHNDMEERFPKAKACDALLDDDPVSHDGLETRGVLIGSRKITKSVEDTKVHGLKA